MKSGLFLLAAAAIALLPMLPTEVSGLERIYQVRTCEIDRSSYQKWAYDRSGKRYSYRVTVITYKDLYSNGSFRIRKETIR